MPAVYTIYKTSKMCFCIRALLSACDEMLFSVYVLCGCYVWITILVQDGVQTHECGQRRNHQTPADHYKTKKTESPPNSWPFHVGVYSSALGPYPYCGGTLIASKWVLTAAHCIKIALQCKYAPYGQFFSYHDVTGHQMVVVLANHIYTPLQPPAYNVRVKGVIMHPLFDGTKSKSGFDIALLQLDGEVKRTRWTEYACLPEPGIFLPTGNFCNFAGWGVIPNPPNLPIQRLSETLMEVRIPIASTAECKPTTAFLDETEAFCTNNAYGALCNGDSGGGLHCVTEDGSKWFVYGVFSGGPPNCMMGFDVFALTATKLSWIKQVMTSDP